MQSQSLLHVKRREGGTDNEENDNERCESRVCSLPPEGHDIHFGCQLLLKNLKCGDVGRDPFVEIRRGEVKINLEPTVSAASDLSATELFPID